MAENNNDDLIYGRVVESCASVGVDTQKGIAKICSISQESVSKWHTRRNIPTLRNMIAISQRTKHTVQWLYTGEGPKITAGRNSAEEILLTLLNGLSDVDRADVLEYARFRAQS